MRTIRAQQLLGRIVVDHDGQRLGRVSDLVAERREDELEIVALLVGPPAWLRRMASRRTKWLGEATRVEWSRLAAFEPVVRLRPPLD